MGGVAPADGHSLELIRERREGLQVCEVKSGNGNLAKCVIDLRASRGRGRKEERRKEFRGFLQMAANYAV